MASQGPSNGHGLSDGESVAVKQNSGSAKVGEIRRILRSTTFKGILWVVAAVVVAAVLLKWLKPHPTYPATAASVPGASIVIGTFITLYGLFLGGFGVLASFVGKKGVMKARSLEILRVAAIGVLVAGAFVDLWRVIDSTNDLFTAATSGLNYSHLHDDVIDFQIYFGINVVVVAFSIWAACWLPGPT